MIDESVTEMSDAIEENTLTRSRVIEKFTTPGSSSEYVTVKLDRWFYYIDRAKLTLVEGVYYKEELEEIMDKCMRADAEVTAGLKPSSDCPRHFTIACRPSDLVFLAKDILNLYKGYENINDKH